MILLDTVPIYTTPLWFIIILIITGSTLFITIIEGESDIAGIIAVVCVLILAVAIILGICGIPKVYSHDEYIVELKDMSATEFFSKYEITKTFEYSNAWQVKKKDGVK